MSFKRDKHDEDDAVRNAFQNLDKTVVLQEARLFNKTPVNARKCAHILTKILYLLNQGEQLVTAEATDVFFAMTKLFQSKDIILRRMVYLGIKELSSIAEDVIIVTSSLTKDMTGKEDMYKAAAIRALCSITDASMLQSIERYMRQAIVDKNPSVSSAALVSSLHMAHENCGDIVKRWANEVQEALSSDNVMIQYHALGLLYHIRKQDRLAITKLVAKLTKSSMKSPFAACFLIRVASKLVEEEDYPLSDSTAFDFIEACLRHKSEAVVYEAAQAIVNLSKTTTRELGPAVSVLQIFCSSPKATLRFAAVRTLNKVAMNHPAAVTACNVDLENLITDSNRSIATLAITTLLKTGAESSVDRLMKQISTFVNEISDEFKVVVVHAIRALCIKFPRKHAILMNFLSSMLREEGGLEYKAAIADTIITIIEDNPDAKESGLSHLCEFIEDCEHTSLAVKILFLLGREGPKTSQPSKYIRFIYNRVILEKPVVRAAAVSALGQFGAACPDLLPNVLVLLRRCQLDSDDEVRDRATYFSCLLDTNDQHLFTKFILESPQVSIPNLEKMLSEYLESECDEPFDLESVPKAPIVTASKPPSDAFMDEAPPIKKVRPADSYADKLKAIPEFADLPGALLFSSEPTELTESETEYVVKCVKHCFPHHIILQLKCTNTLSDQLLENVDLDVELPDEYELLKVIPCASLPYNQPGDVYALLKFPSELNDSVGTVCLQMKFVVKDCDPDTGEPESDEGYTDQYKLEDLEISLSDQIQRIPKNNFSMAWEIAKETYYETEGTYALTSMSSLEEAVQNIVQFLGLQPADRSDRVPAGSTSHTLYLSGVFRGEFEVLARAKLALDNGVTMHLTVRSTNPDVPEFIASNII